MINRITGEIHFTWGQHIRPQGLIPPLVLEECRPFPAKEHFIYMLGTWPSEHGPFVVGVVVDGDLRIQGALLCHWIRDYRQRVPGDPERRAYHQAVIRADLAGQREFSWGSVSCRHDPVDNRNWLIVNYAPGPQVLALPPDRFGQLLARERECGVEEDEVRAVAA